MIEFADSNLWPASIIHCYTNCPVNYFMSLNTIPDEACVCDTANFYFGVYDNCLLDCDLMPNSYGNIDIH